MSQPRINGEADLFLPFPFQGRTVNAAEAAFAIPLERLENKTRRHAVCDASLDDICGSEMTNQEPESAHKAWIPVIPTFEAQWAGLNPLRIKVT